MRSLLTLIIVGLWVGACARTPATLTPAAFEDGCAGQWVLELRNNTAHTFDVSWTSYGNPNSQRLLGKASPGVTRFTVAGRGSPHYSIPMSAGEPQDAVRYRILCGTRA